MSQRCLNCAHWRDRGSKERPGECRAHPPTLLIGRRLFLSRTGPSGLDLLGKWPETEASEWCGEWKPEHGPVP